MSDLKTNLESLRIDRGARQRAGFGWQTWATLIVILVAGGVGIRWWVVKARAADVTAAVVKEETGSASGTAVLNASGYVTARRRATVSSKITGKVMAVMVEEGMRVRQGQVLARLDDASARANLNLAEAQLAAARHAVEENDVRLREARLTLDRREQLSKEGVIGKADLDAAQAEFDSLRARVTLAQRQVDVAERQVSIRQTDLDDTIVKAPFDGVAISKDAQPGEMVSPVSAGGGFTRTGICTMVDMSSLEIEVDVNESYITRVTPDQKVTAVLDAYPDWKIPGHVITTVPTADRQKATVRVRIGFDQLDPRILPDMGVKVTFMQEEAADSVSPARRARILVPKSAVRIIEGRQVVFIVRDDRVERRAIGIGEVRGDQVEVVSGLNPGERVVVQGPAELADGDKVVVK
jgi:RND family efflux transporter MFP subunit